MIGTSNSVQTPALRRETKIAIKLLSNNVFESVKVRMIFSVYAFGSAGPLYRLKYISINFACEHALCIDYISKAKISRCSKGSDGMTLRPTCICLVSSGFHDITSQYRSLSFLQSKLHEKNRLRDSARGCINFSQLS